MFPNKYLVGIGPPPTVAPPTTTPPTAHGCADADRADRHRAAGDRCATGRPCASPGTLILTRSIPGQ